MFDNIRADLRRAIPRNTGHLWSELLNPGTQAVIAYRFSHWSAKLRVPVVRQFFFVVRLFVDYYVRALLGIFISTQAEIGPGLVVHTWGGIFVPPIKVGRNLLLSHGVVINWRCASIGDNVRLHPGCKIGEGVRLGHRVCIGPNAVVNESVADDSTVLVPPPRYMKIHFAPKYAPVDDDAQDENKREAKSA